MSMSCTAQGSQFLEAHVEDRGEAIEAGLPREPLSTGETDWVLDIIATVDNFCKEWGWE